MKNEIRSGIIICSKYGSATFRRISKEVLTQLIDIKYEAYPFTHSLTLLNETTQEDWYEQVNKDKSKLNLIVNVDGNDVGLMSFNDIDHINRKCSWVMHMFKKHIGKGYGTTVYFCGAKFCFDILNMHRIEGEVLIDNKVAIHLNDKCGFKQEGTKRSAIFKNGKYIDSIVIGLLKEDFNG